MPEQGDDYSSPPVQGGDRKKRFPLLVCLVVFILLGFLGIAGIFAVIKLIKKEGGPPQVSRGPEGFTFVPASTYRASSGAKDEEKYEPYGKSSEIDRRELAPSTAPQTYSLQPVMNVIIPGGLLEAPTPLVINAITELSHVPSFYKEEMAYDISLGEMHELPMPVTIEFIIPSDLDLQDLTVAHWEKVRALWMEMPFTIREGRFLQVAASRLSPFAVFSGGKKLADAAGLLAGSPTPSAGASPVPHGAEIYKTAHFAINFNHNEITSPFPLAELQKYDNRVRQEYDTFKQSHDSRSSLVHLFIERMGCDLESAYAAYETSGFKMPATPVCVNVYQPANFNENPRWRALQNDIRIPANLSSIVEMRLETAHELFHMVQDQYYVMSAVHINGRGWWIEATAEYAAVAIAWPAYGPPGKSINFNYTEKPITYFSERLTDPSNGHQYHTAYLLDYLVKRDGSTFKKLWDHVSAAGNEVSALRSYGWRTPLADMYRSFAAFLLLSGSSPARKAVKDRFNYIIPLSVIDQKTPSASMKFALPAPFSARLWAVEAVAPPAQGGLRRTSLISINSGSDLPECVSVVLYRMKKGECPSGTPQPLSTVAGGTCKVTIELSSSERLYILVINTGSEQREVTLNIGNSAPRFAITPNSFSGPVGRKIPFAVQAENLPEGAVPEYFWDYGDRVNSGWTSQERISTLYPRPYESITVIVKVRDRKTGAMLGGASAKGTIVNGPPAGRFTFTMDVDPGLYQHSEFGMLKEMVCTVENGRVKGMKSALLGTRMEGDEKVEMTFNCSLDGTYDALAGTMKGKLSLALQQTRFGPKQDFDRETRQLVTNYVVYRTGARQAADGTLEGTIRPGSGGSGTLNGTYRVSRLRWNRPTGVNSQAIFNAMRPEETFETVKSFSWPVVLKSK